MGHKERTLEWFKKYGSLTSLEAVYNLGNTRLAVTISRLRKEGYVITSAKETGVNRFSEKCQYVRYFLKKEPDNKIKDIIKSK